MAGRTTAICTLSLLAMLLLHSVSSSTCRNAFAIGRAMTSAYLGQLMRKSALLRSQQSLRGLFVQMRVTTGHDSAGDVLDERRAFDHMVEFLQETGPIRVSELQTAYRRYPWLKPAIKRMGGARQFFSSHRGTFRWVEMGQVTWCMLEGQTFQDFDGDFGEENYLRDNRGVTPASLGYYFGAGGYVGEIGDGVMEWGCDSDGYEI